MNEGGSKDTSVSRHALHRSCVMARCIRSSVVSGRCYLAGLHKYVNEMGAAQAGVIFAPRQRGACLQGSGSSRLPSMAAVALYVKALDVTTDYSEQEPWFTCFKLAAAVTMFQDEAGSSPSAGVGGGGLPGASSAPDEQAAASHLLGGQPALEPQVERSREVRRKQREATKQRRAAAVQELQQSRAWKQAGAHPGGSVEGSSSRTATMGNNGKKGKSNLHSKAHDSKEFYDSGDDKRDECADVDPDKPCSSGRADVMRNGLSPEALSLSGRSNSFADSPMFTTSASLTERSNSSISRCRQRASSRSHIWVGMTGSRRAQRLWQDHGRPWLPCGRKRGHRQSLWSFGPLAVRSSSPLWKTLRHEDSGAGPIRCWRRIRGQPLRRDKDVLYGASPRHFSIGGCRLLRWLLHCFSLVSLVISYARGPLLVRAPSRRFSGYREAIVKDLVVEEVGRILYTDLGVDISYHGLNSSSVVWRDFEDPDSEGEPVLASGWAVKAVSPGP